MAFDLHPNSELIHAGVRVNLRQAELPRRSGGVHRREIAEVADSVVILPLLAPDTVVLIRNERFSVKQTLLELPAGTLEPDEAPADCAYREVMEETGYRADAVDRLTAFYPTPGFCTELMHAYLATGLTHVGQDLDETERIIPEPTPLADAYEMICDGAIQDAKSIAILLFHRVFDRSD